MERQEMSFPTQMHPTPLTMRDIMLNVDNFDGDPDSLEPSESELILVTAKTLRLEYKGLLVLDNQLQSVCNLTRLFLDNNCIECINNLQALVHLQWLDLSFNRIRCIQGLETLVKLEVLSLFSNRISSLHGLEHQQQLRVLRIGRNNIEDLEEIKILRQLKVLQTLSLRENNVCTKPLYKEFVLAMLPQLVFLEFDRLTKDEFELANKAFRSELANIERKESEESERLRCGDAKRVELELEQRAHVTNIAYLRSSLDMGIDTREEKLALHTLGAEAQRLQTHFEQRMDMLALDLRNLAIDFMEKRDEEKAEFNEALLKFREETQNKNVQVTEKLLEQKQGLFEALKKHNNENGEEDRNEFKKKRIEARNELDNKIKLAWNTAMHNEVRLVDHTEKMIDKLSFSLASLDSELLSSSSILFKKASIACSRLFRSLCLIQDLANADQNEPNNDMINIEVVLASAHDRYMNRLKGLESEFEGLVLNESNEFVGELREEELRRNRKCVLALSCFFDKLREEEDELEDLEEQGDEVVLNNNDISIIN